MVNDRDEPKPKVRQEEILLADASGGIPIVALQKQQQQQSVTEKAGRVC